MAWDPQAPGKEMTANVHNTDGGRYIYWTRYGFSINVDDRAVYDQWGNVDDAPRVRLDLGPRDLDLWDHDFVLTALLALGRYGDRYQGGLCIDFGGDDLLIWGPHGWLVPAEHRSDDLRLRRQGGVDLWQASPGVDSQVYLKLKRRGTAYSAWSSRDGVIWSEAGSTIIETPPRYAGAILKTWGQPREESVEFRHFQVTHVEGDPSAARKPKFATDHPYGLFTGSATSFKLVYDLEPSSSERREIPLGLYIRQGSSAGPDPYDRKLYMAYIDGMEEVYARAAASADAAIAGLNFTCVAASLPGFMQFLDGEQDRILIDVHEDYVRNRFPATGAGVSDDKFYLVGQSKSGQVAARFAVCHPNKLVRTVAASPYSLPFPTGRHDWGYGTHLTDAFRERNPRLRIDLERAYDTPLAIVHGESDNVLDRTAEGQPPAKIDGVGYSRLDEGKKWIRQMALKAGRSIEPCLIVCPEVAHGLEGLKTDYSLIYLFGSAADRARLDPRRYRFTLDDEDEEQDISPADVPSELLFYAKFDCYDVRACSADPRYTFLSSRAARAMHLTGTAAEFSSTACRIDHTHSVLAITVGGVTYSHPARFYGRLRLYDSDYSSMLQQSGAVTRRFIEEVVAGRVLYLHTCNGRDAGGPTVDPGASPLAIRLLAGGAVVDARTGTHSPATADLRFWEYDDTCSRLQFRDHSFTLTSLRFGEWRWGVDGTKTPYVAGGSTYEANDIRRSELQTTKRFVQGHFEHWAFPGARA